MLKKNATKQKIKAGQPVIGFRMDFASPFIIEVLGKCGFDFVYLDCEHGSLGQEQCEQMVRAAELSGLTPLVRVPANDPHVILSYLDLGAMGVIIPHCCNKQSAQDAIKAVKYPMEGERGIGGRLYALSGISTAEYIRQANEETMVVVMIEDPEAINNLSEILAVDGLDVLFIGRMDLSISLGIAGQLDNVMVKEAVDKVIAQARGTGKAVGVGAIDAGKPESIRQFINQGAQLFALNTTSILANASRDLLKKIIGS
jgi:4-hydroxy-2-oxoheptanedioate aldolase